MGTWEEIILTIQTFFKAKDNILYYWTSVKIKISMTCVYEDYKVKIKMVQKQLLQLKLKFLLDYNMKIVGDSRRDINITQGCFFQVGRNKQIFGCRRGFLSPFPSKENTATEATDFWLENKVLHNSLCFFIILLALSYICFTCYHYKNH